jgi:predicted transcriptional regulator
MWPSKAVDANELLDAALLRLREQSCATAPVLENGRLAGLLTLENIGELVMINSALGRAHSDEKFSRTPNAG